MGDRVAHLTWLAIGCVLLTLNSPLSAQTQPPASADSPSETTSATAATAGPTQGAISPASRFGPGSEAVSSSATPNYKLLRYDEDYSYLKDPDLRTDFWDPIKYIPIGDWEDCYVSFGAQLRQWFQFYNNFDFGTTPGPNAFLTQRYLFHGDFHFGPNIRFFGQLMSGLENGRIGGPFPDIDENVFDAHQAFLDLVQHFGEEDTLTWRLGRQEMSYGSGRLIDVREGVNLRRSFDAARLLFRVSDWSVDGFWSKPVLNRPGVFDDIPYPDLSLWGLYAVRPLAWLPDGHTDLYYLGYENTHATFDKATPELSTGDELRSSLGTRLWGHPMPWEYDVEAVWQFGRFGRGSIEAWAIASATRYNFDQLPLRPRVGLVADITSGDRNPRSPNLQTFNPMFPTGAYLNLANPIGPANFIQLHPTTDVRFGDKVTLLADWAFVWRESVEDGIYGPFVGPPIRTGQLSRNPFVGSSPSVTLTWNATRHVTVLTSYVHFFAGPFLKETPPGKDMDYVACWVDYTF